MDPHLVLHPMHPVCGKWHHAPMYHKQKAQKLGMKLCTENGMKTAKSARIPFDVENHTIRNQGSSSRQSIATEMFKRIPFDVADPTIRNQSSRQNEGDTERKGRRRG